jgi:hypothetical protein
MLDENVHAGERMRLCYIATFMDAWLTDEIKESLFRPCLEISGNIGRRLNNRLHMQQELDERALTEDFVDSFDTSSPSSVWGATTTELRDHQIYLNISVRKSTREHRTGADLGFTLNRATHGVIRTSANYACLVQCKRVDQAGNVADFYHQVKSTAARQSSLMLDITPSSFYFLFVPPALVKHYCNVEPLAFLSVGQGCSVPAWNLGLFAQDSVSLPFLSGADKEKICGVLVVPALAVEAQEASGKAASLSSILPNCFPFWYWFGQLFVPGFVGDRSGDTLAVARNVATREQSDAPFGVRYAVEISVGNG